VEGSARHLMTGWREPLRPIENRSCINELIRNRAGTELIRSRARRAMCKLSPTGSGRSCTRGDPSPTLPQIRHTCPALSRRNRENSTPLRGHPKTRACQPHSGIGCEGEELHTGIQQHTMNLCNQWDRESVTSIGRSSIVGGDDETAKDTNRNLSRAIRRQVSSEPDGSVPGRGSGASSHGPRDASPHDARETS